MSDTGLICKDCNKEVHYVNDEYECECTGTTKNEKERDILLFGDKLRQLVNVYEFNFIVPAELKTISSHFQADILEMYEKALEK
jgi:hypothetical protein